MNLQIRSLDFSVPVLLPILAVMSVLFGIWIGIPAQARAADDVVIRRWTFDKGAEGWGQPNALSKPAAKDGCLVTGVTGFDPYLHSPVIKLDGRVAKHFAVRMRNTAGTQLKMYWRTSEEPGWSESKTVSVPIRPDGTFHEYAFSVDHPKWTANILQFRFDLEPTDCGSGEWSMDDVAVYRLGPLLTAGIAETRKAVVTAGDEVVYTATLANAGGETLKDIRGDFALPDNMSLVSGETVRMTDALEPGSVLEWTVKAKAAGDSAGEAILRGNSDKAHAAAVTTADVSVKAPVPAFLPGFRTLDDGGFTLTGPETALHFVRARQGITHLAVYRKEAGTWKAVAVSSPISSIAFSDANGNRQRMSLCPTRAEGDQNYVRLTGSMTDGDGSHWRYEFAFQLDGDQVGLRYELSCDADRELLQWKGPALQAGEGSFGGSKADALFPGLEWLTGSEASSNALDIKPPANLRWAPNPVKVTIPVMAVSDGHSVIGLAWDASQRWDGTLSLPVARFSSPNWVQGQPNHMMALTVPSIPDYVNENGDLAVNPYSLKAGKTLTLSAAFLAFGGETSLDAIDRWIKTYGMPDLQGLPRTYEQQIELARRGYTETVWKEGEGFRHCVGWDPLVAPAHAYMLLIDRLNSKNLDDATAKELDRRINWTKEAAGPAGLASESGSHLGGWELPFYLGGLSESLESLKGGIDALMRSQLPDGSWIFEPGSEEQESLGNAGSVESGLILTPASDLMRWARITGDQKALDAGLKALDKAKEFRVPRAAQVWECPVHSPDILSAAKGVEAYLDAYIVTGRPEYLDEARYWAKSGLPFVYLWGRDDLPVMEFSTIPIFGATFYTLSWLGRPVQWNGLVYAYRLFQLARYDESFPWAAVAEGITRSGMQQTVADGPNAGTYPDSWVLELNAPQGPYINPEDVAKNVWVLKGANPELSTVVVRDPGIDPAFGGRIHVTSPASLSRAEVKDGVLELAVGFPRGRTTYCLIAGVTEPLGITFGDKTLSETEDLDGSAKGWSYDPLDKRLIVKMAHNGNEMLRVRLKK